LFPPFYSFCLCRSRFLFPLASFPFMLYNLQQNICSLEKKSNAERNRLQSLILGRINPP
jgi:hypothetical protein